LAVAFAGETMTTLGFTAQLSHTDLIAVGAAARSLNRTQLGDALAVTRAYTRAFVLAMTEHELSPPYRPGINPPLWECAHVAWFAEWWCARRAHNLPSGETIAQVPSVWSAADAMFNSNAIAHAARWALPLLARKSALDYMDKTQQAVLSALANADDNDAALYPFRLALFHEAMHLEAIAWCAQALAWPRPAWVRELLDMHRPGEVAVAAMRERLGHQAVGFSFDNERDGHDVSLDAFAIDHTPVSNAQFVQFVESGEYLARTGQRHPAYWRADASGWQARSFDAWFPLDPRAPVIHVSAIEADAYCHWVGRRLPTEHEWEIAAARGLIDWGNSAWEWTASVFAPYVGFSADRYREYSAPWFDGRHRVLRGGSHATLDLMHNARYRNFFMPERHDVFAGFRTCALSP